VFEEAMFENGTKDIAYSIKETKALTIAGGGDTISAIEKFINFEDLDYISTGGGAFLEFLEGNELPGIKIIKKL
jgi:phosphoglycerate kinase